MLYFSGIFVFAIYVMLILFIIGMVSSRKSFISVYYLIGITTILLTALMAVLEEVSYKYPENVECPIKHIIPVLGSIQILFEIYYLIVVNSYRISIGAQIF